MNLPGILYVDDEAINLELLELTFKNEFRVYTAESAEEGLLLLEQNPDVRVVISDLKMPKMNGLNFVRRVKEMDKSKTCMLLSGFMESDVMLEGFSKDLIFRYLMKPWSKEELQESIQEALGV